MSLLPALVVLLGPTAAGKTAVAERLALERGGEILSADAFAVYRGMDIGTAKPSPERRAEIPYHLVDAVDPAESYSAGRWAAEARAAAEEIARRGRIPIVCGGSGFYISALLEGLPPGSARDASLREALARWAAARGPEAAHRVLRLNDPEAAGRIAAGNLRYTLRALEIVLLTGETASARLRAPKMDWLARWRLIKVGIVLPRADLYARIETRVRQMLSAGWDREVRRLLESGLSLESNAFQAIGYREVAEWVLGHAGREETEKRIVTATRRLARRQRTWFSHERDVLWVRPEEALQAVGSRLDLPAETETIG